MVVKVTDTVLPPTAYLSEISPLVRASAERTLGGTESNVIGAGGPEGAAEVVNETAVLFSRYVTEMLEGGGGLHTMKWSKPKDICGIKDFSSAG